MPSRIMIVVPRIDRRPRRRLDTSQRRAAILDGARDAFSRGSYQQVSLATIAARADASEALVLRYFSSKAELYVAVVTAAIESLLESQRIADTALGPHAAPRLRLATSAHVYLDFVAARPLGWAGPLRDAYGEPVEAGRLRARLRDHYVDLLRPLLGLDPRRPRDHALYGYLGFLDAACLAWVDGGCPDSERAAIVAMAVGALDGALDAGPAPGPGASG